MKVFFINLLSIFLVNALCVFLIRTFASGIPNWTTIVFSIALGFFWKEIPLREKEKA